MEKVKVTSIIHLEICCLLMEIGSQAKEGQEKFILQKLFVSVYVLTLGKYIGSWNLLAWRMGWSLACWNGFVAGRVNSQVKLLYLWGWGEGMCPPNRQHNCQMNLLSVQGRWMYICSWVVTYMYTVDRDNLTLQMTTQHMNLKNRWKLCLCGTWNSNIW